MKNLIGLIGGVLFGIGLVISGMTNPSKVTGFLDVFGDWDASLAFVMGGAVGVNLIFFRFIFKRGPVFTGEFSLPTKLKLDKSLIIGSMLFGIGWGLSGICPGPGIVNLVTLDSSAVLFITSLIAGMIIHKVSLREK